MNGTELGQDDQSESGPKYMPSESGHEIVRGRCLRPGRRADNWGGGCHLA